MKVAERCEKEGASVIYIQGDMGNEEDCEKVINQTISKFHRIDILIINHAVADDNLFM